MIIESGSRAKGKIKTWGTEETKGGNLALIFGVEVYAVAPPDTYGDSDFEELDRPRGAQVRMTLSRTGNTDWIFDILKKITGDDDFELERFDLEESDNPYNLEGTEVPLLYKSREWNGKTYLEASFLFPKPKGKLTAWGQKLMDYKVRQALENPPPDASRSTVEDSPDPSYNPTTTKKPRKKQEA